MISRQADGKQHILKNMIKLMRPKHWLKNVLIFICVTFSGRLFELNALLRTLGGFLVFSLLSSAIYTLNDIQDVEADRQHEVKRYRPIASGAVSTNSAYLLVLLLVSAALALNGLVCGPMWKSFLLMLTYFIVNLGYSMGLKHVPFLDIFLLVFGFLIRVLYGAAIIEENVSKWVLLTILSLSFYMSLGKRRNELLKSNGQTATRQVLRYYTFNFLDKFMYLCLTIAIVFYALWSADETVIAKFHTDKLIWTVPWVILLMMKYSADIESDSHGDPVDVITHDKLLLLLTSVYGFIMLFIIYLPGI